MWKILIQHIYSFRPSGIFIAALPHTRFRKKHVQHCKSKYDSKKVFHGYKLNFTPSLFFYKKLENVRACLQYACIGLL